MSRTLNALTMLPRRCKAEQLVMVGDRYLTDIVYGNRMGALTIRTAPLTLHGEPRTVKLVWLASQCSVDPPFP